MRAVARGRGKAAVLLALAPVFFLAGAVGLAVPTGAPGGGGPSQAGDPVTVSPAGAGVDDTIAALQARVRRIPGDQVALATLGLAYVQKATVAVDPAYYPKAEAVLRRSLEIDEAENFTAAAGMAALAAARHDFELAREWAQRGLDINGSNPTLYGALVDALTQLGRYDEAFAATQKMVDLRPDTASLARVSYSWELRGNVTEAQANMRRALEDATTAADRAFTRYQLGQLALHAGDPVVALDEYDAGLKADPTYVILHEGRAKALAALGRTEEALAEFALVTDALPVPAYLIEYGELLESLGRVDEAREQYELFGAEEEIFRAGGVILDVESALFHADHGDPAQALEIAEKGVRARPFLEMEDAYAWALHVNGRDAEALEWSARARRLGTRSALFLFHAGMIEHSLGHADQARSLLAASLDTDPHFNPLQAGVARRTLEKLGPATG